MESSLVLFCTLCLIATQIVTAFEEASLGNDVKNIVHKFNQVDITNENSVEYNNHNQEKVHEPNPCHMVNTKYGCCWDQKNIALGPNGKGCPACKDHRHMKCKNWKKNCHEKIVSAMCPVTCGLCPNTAKPVQRGCKNDKFWNKLCPVYKRLGFCTQSTISRHCKLTCSKCT
ncbi:uncharacterized protein [Clytia hemisphaerica]|uniref:ShKT domain-containing protein n=1 Tax=Clytia hemisphaerica TaxID=252671 RepID=A0A7M6DPG3_9CNID